jgi:hypothetical protein
MATRRIYLDSGSIKFQDDDETTPRKLTEMDDGDNIVIPNNFVKDEDDMSSDSASHVPSQQSVKAYVDLKIKSEASSATPTADVGNRRNKYNLTALATDPTFASPSGTSQDGDTLVIRIKDNGTARALSWNSVFRACGVSLPTTTTISKTMYVGFVYNSTDSKWDCIAVSEEF